MLGRMTDAERDRFDGLLEEAMEGLPVRVRAMLEEVPLIVDDRPEDELVRRLALELGEDVSEPGAVEEFASELCGLHSGMMITERSVEDAGEGHVVALEKAPGIGFDTYIVSGLAPFER